MFYLSVVCMRVCVWVQRVINSLKKRVVVEACAVSLWSEMDPFDLRWTHVWRHISVCVLVVCVCVCAGDVHVCICVCVRLRVCWRICVKGHIMSNRTSYVWSYWDLNVQSLHCKRLSIMWNRLFDQPRHYVTVIEHRWRLTRHDDHRSLKLNGSLNVNNVVPQFILIRCTWI